jgi:hypothetical protein
MARKEEARACLEDWIRVRNETDVKCEVKFLRVGMND